LGYWVYLDNVTTQEQADALGSALAKTGVEDSYLESGAAARAPQ
jgi:hypothetical protein